ncbi:MAG: HAD-IIB family hydrolase [Deltaproteobacteria bacterium]|nr:HAD-IIB family hydrolase [Deltaproteobacteria bacterium]
MKKSRSIKTDNPPFIVIFTDLDGTLLDHDTYQWDSAKPALNLCKRLHIPIVLVSSKTRAEMDVLRKNMGLSSPFISENGGGIFFPTEGLDYAPAGTQLAENIYRLEMGTPYEILVKALNEIRNELDLTIRGFSEMTPEEISHLTNLDREDARLAAMREFDEPFILPDHQNIDADDLQKAAQKRGLQITTGGRFFHIIGKNDKGGAVKTLILWYKQQHSNVFSIALGDSPNDFSMLRQVDQAILVRPETDYPFIADEIPGIRFAPEKGPEGWNRAIMELLDKKIQGGN